MSHSIIDRLAAKAGQLYSLPSVAMEVLALTGDPTVDAQALKRCIQNDPALTTKLLRVVNSSLFGLSRKVSDLNQALALLGTKPLKLLVLGFSLPADLFHGVHAEVLGWYWRHTLTRAVAAREICETQWKQPGDEAFIAGLLQDLGILLLTQELGDPYVRFLQKALELGQDLSGAEVKTIGFDHTALTARLLDHWGLPKALVDAASRKNGSAGPNQASPSLVETLQLAELVARFLADERPEVLAELHEVARCRHGLDREQVEAILVHLEPKVSQLAEVLSLQLPEGLRWEDLVCAAHAQLARVAEEAVGDLLSEPDRDDELIRESRILVDEFRKLSRTVTGPRSHVAFGGAGEGSTARVPATADRAVAVAAPDHGVPRASAAPPASRQRFAMKDDATAELERKLDAAIASCRHSRSPLSLLLVELEQHDELVYSCDSIVRLESACRGLDHPRIICDPYHQAGFAVILPECDRQQAVELGGRVLQAFAQLTSFVSPDGPVLNVGVGAAAVSLPPKNFRAEQLLAAAKRCLYGSHASGGTVVKSIEVYS
jgi:HD-like signal output (HDOD) protein/GGDEF domain-containing protein